MLKNIVNVLKVLTSFELELAGNLSHTANTGRERKSRAEAESWTVFLFRWDKCPATQFSLIKKGTLKKYTGMELCSPERVPQGPPQGVDARVSQAEHGVGARACLSLPTSLFSLVIHSDGDDKTGLL